jgi:hypothetical protein
LIHDPRKGDLISDRLSLQGNPAVKNDWWINPKTNEQVDFVDFARSEGRFAKQFDRDGNPSQILQEARQDRLDNWHVLQELAGLRGKGVNKQPAKKAPAKPAAPTGTNGNGQKPAAKKSAEGTLAVGSRVKYNDGSKWTSGSLASLDPVVVSLDDNTELSISAELLNKAVAEGLIVGE